MYICIYVYIYMYMYIYMYIIHPPYIEFETKTIKNCVLTMKILTMKTGRATGFGVRYTYCFARLITYLSKVPINSKSRWG